MLCNDLGMLATSSAVLGMLQQGPRSSTSKRNPPTCYLINCEAKGVVYHQASICGNLVVHYFLGFTAYKAASGGISLRCETPRTLLKHAEDVASMPRMLQACLGCCKACLGRCKACRERPRTLPSMPRSCKASLHILGSHTFIFTSNT